MKILVLNGSPKREKSDTLHLTNAFLTGMKDFAEQEVHILHVIDRHIEPCMGCFSCKRGGGKCIHGDDMRKILEEILSSDLLIFSFPLYCYGMPAPLKNLLDRTMPLSTLAMERVDGRYEHTAQADFSHLRYVMISGCGFPDGENNFRAMCLQFQMMFPNNTTMLTVPEAPMFNAPEAEPVTKPFLELVRQAGREYAETREISKETMQKLSVPMIPEEQYAAICNQTQ
ncbi:MULTISPECIES: flavodoxin family protein [unclassified Ruminococcus]|uniref:flavodoxin family protein n=1 Tax=unclassified Ruminococcus TaxID=2608920 RepID=UPI00210A3B92|nr:MULTISPECIES: flavodoxin family protein [unclassified Ruminococcus]